MVQALQTLLPSISIVVATRNRLPRLRSCVESIRAQTYPHALTELIIVDDGSTDDTPTYLAELAKREPWVKVINQPHGWQAAARNHGITASNGELIAITDDDCTVAEDWLNAIAIEMRNPDVAAIGGRVLAPGESLVARYLNHVRALDPALGPDGTPRYLVTANACFRRDSLVEVGFFDEQFASTGGEDSELSLRMQHRGMTLRFTPSCRVSHWYEPSVKSFLARYYRYGTSSRKIFEKHRHWQHWIPRADRELRSCVEGDAWLRTFREVRDNQLRVWFCAMRIFQCVSYLAGYLGITDEEGLRRIQPSERTWYAMTNSLSKPIDKYFTKPLSEGLIQMLSTEVGMPSPYDVCTKSNNIAQLGRHYQLALDTGDMRSWTATLFGVLDIDTLLDSAVSSTFPCPRPSIPDDSIPVATRVGWTRQRQAVRKAYAKRYAQFLRELSSLPDQHSLRDFEALCYARAIDVNRFLEWYGDLAERDDTPYGFLLSWLPWRRRKRSNYGDDGSNYDRDYDWY